MKKARHYPGNIILVPKYDKGIKPKLNHKTFQCFIDWFKQKSVLTRVLFLVMGVASTIWFLIRVIPKPQRAAYPCMRVAAPMMSGFVIWLLSVLAATFTFRHARKSLKNTKYLVGVLSLFISIAAVIISLLIPSTDSIASNLISGKGYVPNAPVGQAQGVNPGRVVWVWDPDATNEDMKNVSSDYWYQNGNADQAVIDTMLDQGILDLAGIEDNTVVAWDSLFTWFNRKQGHGNHAYQPGEKIAIKLNITNSCCNVVNYSKTKDRERMDNTPELVFSLLKQLIDVYGISQEDIYIGDPYRSFTNMYWNLCHSQFPDVHYIDGNGETGREQTKPSEEQVLIFSDGQFKSSLPQYYLDASYIINLPSLKSHNATGFTLAAKNHQGSIIEQETDPSKQTANYMHYSMPYKNHYMRQYRNLVDYMGHKDMGGKTFLYLVDGIWGGYDWQGYIYKWDMKPFNWDYPSSVFLSQDAVAIESVIFDFMLEEYKIPKDDGRVQFPYMAGVDDYLLQAADNSFWPNDLQYDPEGDGTFIGSLGVYEHWDNSVDMQYSRNLGTGDGIEFVKIFMDDITGVDDILLNKMTRLYPNPVNDQVTVEIQNNWLGMVSFKIFDIEGKLIRLKSKEKQDEILKVILDMTNLNSGLYVVDISFNGDHISRKIQKQ